MNLTPPSDFPLSAFMDLHTEATKPPEASVEDTDEELFPKQKNQSNESAQQKVHQDLHFGVRTKPNDRFVWNLHLLKPVIDTLHPDWVLYITHGFVVQSNISVYGRSLYITLIARRSNKYAGTRFLKRGANFEVSSIIYSLFESSLNFVLNFRAMWPMKLRPNKWFMTLAYLPSLTAILVLLCK